MIGMRLRVCLGLGLFGRRGNSVIHLNLSFFFLQVSVNVPYNL
jgi:hypothetical protein